MLEEHSAKIIVRMKGVGRELNRPYAKLSRASASKQANIINIFTGTLW